MKNATQSSLFEDDPVSFYKTVTTESQTQSSVNDPSQLSCDVLSEEVVAAHWGKPDIVLTFDSYPLLSDHLLEEGYTQVSHHMCY